MLQLEPLEARELLSTVQDFNTPGVGTAFTTQQYGNPPGPTVVPLSSSNSVMQMTSGLAAVAGQNNQVTFQTSDFGVFNQANASFRFRIIPGSGRGDGVSFALLNTNTYGTSGAATPSPLPEKALFTGSLGLGFNTFQGASDPSDNFVTVSFNSTPVQQIPIDKLTLDFASGFFITASLGVNFVSGSISLTLTQDAGSPINVFNNLVIAGLGPYQSRVNFAARAVDNLASTQIDDVDVQYFGARAPGSISFSSATYVVPENTTTGMAQIEVVRAGGTAGTLVVNFVSADGTAQHGVNYTSITQTLSFGEGETTKTVLLPIINDHVSGPNKTVSLFLSNPTLAATLARPLRATLTIVDTNGPAPTVSPDVEIEHVAGTRRVSGFRVFFDLPMDTASAQRLSNYQLILPPLRRGGRKRVLRFTSAVLDSSGFFVTLSRNRLSRVHLTRAFQILVRGRPTTGLLAANGTFLAGTGGRSGTDALLRVSI